MSDKRLRRKLKTFTLSAKFWWVLILVGFFSRIATWLFPYDSDHWIFYYVGKHWFDGGTLYLTVWDHKSPIIFAINGFMSFIFGDIDILHRIFFTIIAAASTWLFYITCKGLLSYSGIRNIEGSSRLATLFFVFWSNLSQFTNSGNTTENFGVFFLLTSLYFYLRYRNKNQLSWLFYSGISISFLVLLKINFSILIIPLIADFILNNRRNIKKIISDGLVWVTPLLAHSLYWVIYFRDRNLLNEAFVASFSFNSKYLRAGWAGNISGQLIFIIILIIAACFFAGFIYNAFKMRKFSQKGILITGIAVSSVLFSVILGTFYDHYYLITIPYFCMLIAFYWRQVASSKLFLIFCYIGLVGSYGISIKQLYNRYYGYVKEESVMMQNAADYIASNTIPSDKIIYHGYGATFYQLSNRDSGSRFISASHPLIDERENFGYQLTEKHISDMERSIPKYLIIKNSTKELYNQNTKVKNYIESKYTLETKLPGYEVLRRN